MKVSTFLALLRVISACGGCSRDSEDIDRRSEASSMAAAEDQTPAVLGGSSAAAAEALTLAGPSASTGLPYPAESRVPSLSNPVQKVGYSGITSYYFVDRYNRCRQRGGSPDQCNATADSCYIQDAGRGGYLTGASYFSYLLVGMRAFDAFRRYDCSAACFHCCFVPPQEDGSGGGCHSAFDATYTPTINCNSDRYGAGVKDLGPTLVVDPAPQGKWCLAIQQVCTHLALCAVPSAPRPEPPPAGSINGGGGVGRCPTDFDEEPPPGADPFQVSDLTKSYMRSEDAVKQRAHHFERQAQAEMRKLIDSLPETTDRRMLVDFFTKRGGVRWAQAMRELEPFSGQFRYFKVTNADGTLVERASYRQASSFLNTITFLASIPNLYYRLAYVESRVWTTTEKSEYLAQVGGDADAALLKLMSPLSLAVLKRMGLQDYRLLAVPLANEEPSPRTYDGVVLGAAPLVAVDSAVADSSGEVQVRLSVEDADFDASIMVTYPVAISWGDDSVTSHTFDPANPAVTFTHRYARPGKYPIYATLANSSGLRGIGGRVVNVATVSNLTPARLPSVSEIYLEGVYGFSEANADWGRLALEVYGVPEGGTDLVELGWSEDKVLLARKKTEFATILGTNDGRTALAKLVIKPIQYAGTAGWPYFVVPRIRLATTTARGVTVSQTLQMKASQLKVYYTGRLAPITGAQLEVESNGGIILPIYRSNPNVVGNQCNGAPCLAVDRIEVDLIPSMFKGMSLGIPPAHVQNLAEGLTASWVEDLPNKFIPATTSANSVCDNKPGIMRIDVAGVTSMAGGTRTRFKALARKADGTTIDATKLVTWSSTDESVLFVSNTAGSKGYATASDRPGSATVKATLEVNSSENFSACYREVPGCESAFSFGSPETLITGSRTIANTATQSGFRYYRLVSESLYGNPGRLWLHDLQFRFYGIWQPNAMSSATDGTIGGLPAKVTASHEDSSHLYKAFKAFDFDRYLTQWKTPSSALLFKTTAPYDALQPVWLQVDFLGNKVAVDGMKLGASSSARWYFPDAVRLEGSNDGVAWILISGSQFTVPATWTTNVHTKTWTYAN